MWFYFISGLFLTFSPWITILCPQVPLTTYYFRVIAYNEFGISTPCASEETVCDHEDDKDDKDDKDDEDGQNVDKMLIKWGNC